MSCEPGPRLSVPAELRAAVEVLAATGAGSPRVDAELLLAHLLGRSRTQLLLAGGLDAGTAVRYRELVGQRAEGIPLQHLTGTAPFRHLELVVGPGVFIPRPETELVLELATAQLRVAGTVVDLCAGSGAIALAVAQEYPAARVVAVERSAAALEWLRRNATARAAAGDRPIEVVPADVTDPGLLAGLTGSVDVVLSNPPYVPERLRAELSVEVSHDPDEAVFAGEDGLALMPGLLRTAARLLRPGGLAVIEHDESQPKSMTRLLIEGQSWHTVAAHTDLAGQARFATAHRR
ncbi:peptide chain release factor N(5)-glutamine methyltransferase [Jatrophihabitans lederbergiae]|uniref:Release factor glutamine methyltransferase n=1 Tax=Jatrophihabitans lederbergiae TaxID=3075547 RepID=A0ABU2J468_9ACTN|nr:peptide chain release factor N(5)-glutamine methyltransferase [Jatrophihabitans sp. DSM 44399]MDT0259785.1 peptide chain release factor N(5)-glutamine methyltransferase [Jatrophihabitans sp. DSM 44399]